jgi:hypothetical protein
MKTRHYRIAAVTVLAAILAGCALLAAGASRTPVTPEELREQAAEAERQDRTQQLHDLSARQQRQKLLQQLEQTQETLHDLLETAQSLSSRMDALLDSDEGKRLAADPSLFTTFCHLYGEPHVSIDQIAVMANDVADLVQRLKVADDGPDVGLPLNQQAIQQAENFASLSRNWSAVLGESISTLNDIVHQAPTDPNVSQAKTLRQAIDADIARAHLLRSQAQIVGEARASDETSETLTSAYYKAALVMANARATLAERRNQILIEKMQDEMTAREEEHNRQLLQNEEEHRRRFYEADKRLKDALAEIEELKKRDQTQRVIRAAQVETEMQTQLDAAEKERLKALAKSLEVQTLLGPLFADGTWQPRQPIGVYETGPLSLSRLAAYGVMQRSMTGLIRLLDVMTHPADERRPRMGYPRTFQLLSVSQEDDLRKAHAYLLELAPTLVELKLLAP